MKPNPPGFDALRVMAYCPLCDTRYEPMHARILSESGQMRLIHVTCEECGSATLSLLQEHEAGASSVGLITDLSHTDVLDFHNNVKVTTDDVIDVHQALLTSFSTRFQVPVKKRRSIRAKTRTKVLHTTQG